MKKISYLLAGICMLLMTACQKDIHEDTVSSEPPQIELYQSDDLDIYGNPYETKAKDDHPSRLSELKLHFIDVGQADCTLIQYPNGDNWLIDAGNKADSDFLVKYLKNEGVTEFQGVIATHPHEDHIGGLPRILDEFPVRSFYMPDIPDEYIPTTKIYESLLDALDRNQVPITIPKNGSNIYSVEKYSSLQVLYNGMLGTDDYNTYSIVTELTYGDTVCLFTGDADADVEDWIMQKYKPEELDCDILKAAHHGSSTANQEEWVDLITPEYIFIPCEKDNSYGHPHPSVMKIFEESDAEIYDMSMDGTCVLILNGVDIQVTDEK